VNIPLTFLGKDEYRAMLLRDNKDDAAAIQIENRIINRNDSLTIGLCAGGGFIARFLRLDGSF
jgi:hypothetical protein